MEVIYSCSIISDDYDGVMVLVYMYICIYIYFFLGNYCSCVLKVFIFVVFLVDKKDGQRGVVKQNAGILKINETNTD